MIDALKHLSRVTVEIDGRRAEMWLQAPTAGFELPMLLPPDGRLDAERLAVLFAGFIESIDGTPPSHAQRLALASRASSTAELLKLRSALYDDVRLQGLVYLRCPCCEAEFEIDLIALALALGPAPWPAAAADGTPAEPSLSTLRPLAARPAGATRAASARLALPSARLKLACPFSEAVLGAPVTQQRDAEGWRLWGPVDKPFDHARSYWTFGSPGFRAILRMALALNRLDDARDVTPELIELLPVTDFLFVDAVYHYLNVVPVIDATRASITCMVCNQPFLAVL